MVEDIPAGGRAGAGSGDRRTLPLQRVSHLCLSPGLELHTRGHTFLAAAQRRPTWVTRVHNKPGPGPGIPFCPPSCASCLLLVNPGGSVSSPSSPKGYSHTTGPQGRDVNVPSGRGQCSLPGAVQTFSEHNPQYVWCDFTGRIPGRGLNSPRVIPRARV